MGFYNAFICENGHPVSTTSNSCADKYCSICGKPVISRCKTCNTTIRGKSDEQYGTLANYKVPAYCRSCGKPYPWTIAAIEATRYMLEESDLSAEDQKKLIEVLPDTLAETPNTQLASMRLKKAIAIGGPFIAEGLRDFVTNFACEALKIRLGL